ncbi:LysR family transcriptional regulator [Stappia taiwanensis]|uniref:LysR family transcriptional regulator n=1 Tax=Stappia taiwanensis TaxID=992267 RepID=A0A838XVJ8_9HYPH|nr:LysR substrate-binding domain-containing protein [Stappia taiwanensis]MBA4612516.1 LysR family transcriptional regulator [Stappia taiwanensis]GGF05967.1 LysR family transcriptional regulator [Stappia taiwanensis]
MRYVQLRAFHNVAMAGGFSKAADVLGLTQPAVSDQVRKLEEEYDIALFYRNKRQVSLTDTGHRLLEITRRMFDTENQAMEFLSEARDLRTGSLRIIADSALHLLHLLPPFKQRYPGIEISIRSGNTETVLKALGDYAADVGVLGEMIERPGFTARTLGSEPLIAFVARSHPWSQRSGATLAEICSQPLILRENGSKTRQKFEDEVHRRGLPLQIAIEAEGREAVREIVATGLGVGVVSQAEFGHDPRLAIIPILDADMHMEEALLCLSERAQAKLISAFFEIAAESRTDEQPTG